MKPLKWLKNINKSLWEAVMRVFGPNDDDYPKTGVQPYEGDVNKENS